VDSAVIRLLPLRPPPYDIADPVLHARIVAAAFSQRRKRISNSLRGLADAACIEQCALEPGARAEQLSVADFATLANAAAGSRNTAAPGCIPSPNP
jgi:16S rRNA (adenine1518-N6/adenine1519-N6)-dimethyltransferase